jgi:hypothetical protein
LAISRSLQKTLIDLQSLRVIDFHLLFRSAAEWLLTLLSVLISMFKTSVHLRLENLALRQQLAVFFCGPRKTLQRGLQS